MALPRLSTVIIRLYDMGLFSATVWREVGRDDGVNWQGSVGQRPATRGLLK